MDAELLKQIKEYIEETEMAMEWEVGNCRTFEKLIADHGMPDIYYKVCDLINKVGD